MASSDAILVEGTIFSKKQLVAAHCPGQAIQEIKQVENGLCINQIFVPFSKLGITQPKLGATASKNSRKQLLSCISDCKMQLETCSFLIDDVIAKIASESECELMKQTNGISYHCDENGLNLNGLFFAMDRLKPILKQLTPQDILYKKMKNEKMLYWIESGCRVYIDKWKLVFHVLSTEECNAILSIAQTRPAKGYEPIGVWNQSFREFQTPDYSLEINGIAIHVDRLKQCANLRQLIHAYLHQMHLPVGIRFKKLLEALTEVEMNHILEYCKLWNHPYKVEAESIVCIASTKGLQFCEITIEQARVKEIMSLPKMEQKQEIPRACVTGSSISGVGLGSSCVPHAYTNIGTLNLPDWDSSHFGSVDLNKLIAEIATDQERETIIHSSKLPFCFNQAGVKLCGILFTPDRVLQAIRND